MAGFELDKRAMAKLERQLANQYENLEFKKGATISATEQNILKELKRNGIEPNRVSVKKIAKQMHQ